MALSIKDAQTDQLARELAETTGESLTEAIRVALLERLSRERARRSSTSSLAVTVSRIQARIAALPILDGRTPEEILGYDENGLPT
jgi:antitoxin VapB